MADEHSHQQQHHHNPPDPTIFDDLKRRQSILLTLFDLGSKEALNEARQAPAPSKDYCQLILTFHHVIFRRWKITLHTDSESRCPREVRDTYDDFRYDENTQREIAHVFGKPMLTYLLNITEKGKLDYLSRLPTNLIIKIISFLNLEDIARISQVNSQFRQVSLEPLKNTIKFRYIFGLFPSYAKATRFGWNSTRPITVTKSPMISCV